MFVFILCIFSIITCLSIKAETIKDNNFEIMIDEVSIEIYPQNEMVYEFDEFKKEYWHTPLYTEKIDNYSINPEIVNSDLATNFTDINNPKKTLSVRNIDLNLTFNESTKTIFQNAIKNIAKDQNTNYYGIIKLKYKYTKYNKKYLYQFNYRKQNDVANFYKYHNYSSTEEREYFLQQRYLETINPNNVYQILAVYNYQTNEILDMKDEDDIPFDVKFDIFSNQSSYKYDKNDLIYYINNVNLDVEEKEYKQHNMLAQNKLLFINYDNFNLNGNATYVTSTEVSALSLLSPEHTCDIYSSSHEKHFYKYLASIKCDGEDKYNIELPEKDYFYIKVREKETGIENIQLFNDPNGGSLFGVSSIWTWIFAILYSFRHIIALALIITIILIINHFIKKSKLNKKHSNKKN